jgi:hypothetical protein
VNGDVYFVSDFNAREIHQSGIEDDPLRVSDFGDGLGHRVILCFTMGDCQTYSGEEWKKVRRKKDELRIMKEGTSRTVIGEQGFVISDPACAEATARHGELRRKRRRN